MSATASGGRRIAVRVIVSVGLLALLAWWLNVDDVLSRLASLRVGWVGAAVAVSVVQVALSAWRWSFTAGRLGLRLPWGVAVREYYLAMFLNQVLPGGVVGDVTRAWRHARLADTGPAVRAVVFERASGQLVMSVVTVVSLLLVLPPSRRPPLLGVGLALVALVLVIGGGRRRLREWARMWPMARATWQDARRALFSGSALAWQLGTSCLVVATYIATYVMAARAVGLEAPVSVIGPLVPPVLMSMVVPVSVAGWGIREGTAALVWSVAGLTVSDGVAVSVAYGLIVFVSTLPGVLVLLSADGAGAPEPPTSPSSSV